MKTLLKEEMKVLDKENEHILQIEKNNVNNKVNETNEWNYQDNSSISMIDDILNMNITHTHTQQNYTTIDKIAWFRHTDDHNIKLEALDFVHLYRGLMFVLNDVFPSLNLLTKYLKDIAYICSKLEISIPWTLPTGLVANQSYMKLKDVRIKPLNYSNYTFNSKQQNYTTIDKIAWFRHTDDHNIKLEALDFVKKKIIVKSLKFLPQVMKIMKV